MKRRLAGIVLCGLCAAAAQAGNWPNWRGPGFNGVAAGKGYPTQWSNSENVLWKFDLPGRGASTPIVWGERIVLTCAIDGKNGVICLDRHGKELWQRTVGTEKPGKHVKASGCNPSAATDGRYVYVYFKSGDLACLDLSGKLVWQKNIHEISGEDTLWWDLGTSPVLTRDYLVVAVMQSGPSFLAAFDKATGELKWKRDRMMDAPSEANQSYTTPAVVTENGRETLVVVGADHITAYDAADGKELWRVGGLNPKANGYFRSIASPVVENGIVLAPYARGTTLTAVRLGGTGDVTKSHVVWTKDWKSDKQKLVDVPTPAASGGKVFVCSDWGVLSCLDVASGDVLWSGQTERSGQAFSASPVMVDGKIYLTREDGKVFVAEQGNEFKLLSANDLGPDEFVVATPVFVDGRILIRTYQRLYCIGKS